MALALSEPKLIADMLKIDAEYGWLHCGPPTMTRKLAGSANGAGRMEWPMNSKPDSYTSIRVPKGLSEASFFARAYTSERWARENGRASLSASSRYWRISGRMASTR
ncbi:hypothetical protein D3C76_412290 [compost metagenome]